MIFQHEQKLTATAIICLCFRAYVVPDDKREGVLADLDFREKGGYTRRVVDVHKLDGEDSVKALLYTGTTDNPNFWSVGPSMRS